MDLKETKKKNNKKTSIFILVKNCLPKNCLPKWLHHFAFPPAMNESFCHSTFSPAVGAISALDSGHSSKCVVVFHCSFNLHFLLTYNVTSFPMVICHLCIFSGEVSPRVSDPFFLSCLLSCWVLRVLCILLITVLYQMYLFEDIFFQFVAWLLSWKQRLWRIRVSSMTHLPEYWK